MDRGVEWHKGAVFGSKGADPVRYGCGRAKTLPDGAAIPFPPRLPGDGQGGHARACAQHIGRRARRGARRRRNGAEGVVRKERQEHPGRPEAARILDERSGNIFEYYERRLRELVSALQDRLRTMFRVATTRPVALATARDPVGCVLPGGVVDTLLSAMGVPPVLGALRRRSSGAHATTCETVQTLRDRLHVHLVVAFDRRAPRDDVRGVPRSAASASAGRARCGSAHSFRVEPHEFRVLLVLV